MLKPLLSTCLITSLMTGLALAEDMPEGLSVAKITFASIDLDGDGKANQGDMNVFGESVFLGMDYDSNERVTFEEFSDWDIGFEQAAELEGRPDAVITARRILFGMWDANADGELTMTEMRRAGMMEFNRADLNDDAQLDEREYLLGYSVNIVMRGAINPEISPPAAQ